jgi:hypothetical protein
VVVDSFEDVQRLDDGAVKALLERGRPEEKVWAIWTLALRSGDGTVGKRVEREPDAGVRRTLAVILASHGDTGLLVALARHDPELVVRETAFHLATRLAAGGKVEIGVILEAGQREGAIRIAVLGALEPGAPPPLVEFAHAQLSCGDPNVELEAFEALVRLDTPAERRAARAWMLRLPDVALACERWLRVGTPETLADTFMSAGPPARAQVLRQLRAPRWPVVERLVGSDIELLRQVLARTDIAIPARVLASAILRGEHPGFVDRLTTRLTVAARGRMLVADLRRAIEGDDPTAQLPALGEAARAFARALEVPDGAAVLDELAASHPVEHLIGLENAVGRWLAEIEGPDSLGPMLPALHAHCASRLAAIDGGRATRASRAQPQLALGPGRRPWDEIAHLRELVATIERFTRRD